MPKTDREVLVRSLGKKVRKSEKSEIKLLLNSNFMFRKKYF